MRTKLVATMAVAAVSAFLVAGCSSDTSSDSATADSSSSSSSGSSSTSASASAEFNDADVTFAQRMYPHHDQAVEMAAMVQGRTDNSDILTLASSIEAAQKPEMDQMTEWLSEWGQPAPTSGMGAMDGSGEMDGTGQMGGPGMMDGMDQNSGRGMMSRQDMDGLTALSGAEFDRRWLTMMIAHHTGAIEMANVEIAEGSNPDALEMARNIVTSQQQEIDTMQQLLG